ncbi:MAG TPA: DUF4232 domain-containing protein [Solirubrobacteraceae bacterium]|jgi:hypothetical protein|nr:DUF4232 domain-containing protein [Solirubrobacteraceae bacterium]
MPGTPLRLLAAAALAVALLASHASTSAGAPDKGCATSALALHQGPRVVPRTMQLPLMIEIVNDGRSACTLAGYPRIALLSSSGKVYPFAYRDGGDAEVTGHRPATVTLRPGGGAFVLINKNACIANVNGQLARQVRLTPPGGTGTLTLRSLGGVFLDYCGAGDPGHRVDVSPIAASVSAAEHAR